MSVRLTLSGIRSGLNRLHIDARRIAIGALAVILPLAVLVAPRYARSQQTAEPKLKKDLRSGASYSSWARSEIATGPGLQLKRTKFEKNYGGSEYSFIINCPNRGEIPDEVSANSSRSFCYGSFHPPSRLLQVDTGFFFYYDILIPNGTGGWKPSGYYVDAATKVPLFGGEGARRIECTIKKSGSTDPAVGAPFQCAVSWTGKDNDSEPHWKVTANPVEVIDATNSDNVTRAAQLIGENCKEFDTTSCTWTRTQKSSVFLTDRDDWVQLTDWGDSCPPATKEDVLTVTRGVQISWSDQVGGKIAVKVSGKLIETSIEANYQHAVSQTNSWSQSYTHPIPLGLRQALFLQHGMVEVTGDFSIITDKGSRFLIKDAVFRFPLKKELKVDGRGQPIIVSRIQKAELPCSAKAPAPGPPPARARTGVVTTKNQ